MTRLKLLLITGLILNISISSASTMRILSKFQKELKPTCGETYKAFGKKMMILILKSERSNEKVCEKEHFNRMAIKCELQCEDIVKSFKKIVSEESGDIFGE